MTDTTSEDARRYSRSGFLKRTGAGFRMVDFLGFAGVDPAGRGQ